MNRDLVVEVLTRSDIARDRVGLPHGDEDLLMTMAPDLEGATVTHLATVSRLLRLMDALLRGRETGEGFAEKFSEQWLRIREDLENSELADVVEALDELYEEIQMFCAADHREEESALFGSSRLQELTIAAYEATLPKWTRVVERWRPAG